MSRTSVCITGVGAATPLGTDYASIKANLLAGKSGIGKVTAFSVTDHPTQIGGLVEKIPCPEPFAVDFGGLPRTAQLILWCAVQALQDAGWWDRRGAVRIGFVLGSASEWHAVWEMDFLAGGDRIFAPQSQEESLVHRVRRRLDLDGPAVNLSAACASSNYALALAKRWLELGWVDVCLAGGGDMGITPTTLAGFANLRALSRRNHDPQAASRPFDMERDGFVMGDGGVLFVLERDDTARQRSARIYGQVAGFGASSDAFHMVIPSSDPAPAISAVRQALSSARVNPEEVGYINAHATSTPIGDIAEARALQTVFGPAIDQVPVSSTKSMTGHLLTGAAAFEALACLVALESQALPPTINLQQPDPECRLLHIANESQERPVRVALSNSFGFGGSNTCLALKAA